MMTHVDVLVTIYKKNFQQYSSSMKSDLNTRSNPNKFCFFHHDLHCGEKYHTLTKEIKRLI